VRNLQFILTPLRKQDDPNKLTGASLRASAGELDARFLPLICQTP